MLPSYLTRPEYVIKSDDPTEAPPLVQLVHGGPAIRDDWGFYISHQLLATRGDATHVLEYEDKGTIMDIPQA